MRKLGIILCIMVTLNGLGQAVKTVNLEEALQLNMVTLEAVGNPESTHYQQPIVLKLINKLNQPISIIVANGIIFQADKEDVQDVIITEEELIALNAKQRKSTPLNAMCIEKGNSASNENTRYRLASKAKGDLATLCKKIESGKYHNSLGQYAIWTITDGDDLNNIIGFDEEQATALKTFVAELKGIPVPEYRPEQLEPYQRSTKVKRSTKGYFNYTFSEPRAITIALFDSENRLIREIYNNPNEAAEEHRVDFSFNMEMDRTQTYYVRLLADGKIEMTLTMQGRNG